MSGNKLPKLPKRIGGVKLSKHLRVVGGELLEALSHPLVAERVGAALIAAGTALREGQGDGGAVPPENALQGSAGNATGEAKLDKPAGRGAGKAAGRANGKVSRTRKGKAEGAPAGAASD